MKEKLIDIYISKSADFSKPILIHLRELIHQACPQVEEKMKWSFPHFDYKGEMMCSMAAFKQHCAFSFWKASLMKDPLLIENARSESAMGHLGKIASIKDLPSDKKIIAWIKEAMKLNDQGIKLPPRIKSIVKKDLEVPDDLIKALSMHKKALQIFEAFAYSHKKEYIQWICDAKTKLTRNKRIATAAAWIAEGKGRNWKYERK